MVIIPINRKNKIYQISGTMKQRKKPVIAVFMMIIQQKLPKRRTVIKQKRNHTSFPVMKQHGNKNELPRGRAREVSCLRKVIFQNQTLVVAQKFSRIFLDLQHNFEF